MEEYTKRRIIDVFTFRKTLSSCLFFVLTFFLGQLASLSQGDEIEKYCNVLQKRNPDGFLFHLSHIGKIFFTGGNIFALIISGLLLALLFYLIYFKESSYEDLEIFNSKEEARKALGKNKRFRYSETNTEWISSPNDSTIGFT